MLKKFCSVKTNVFPIKPNAVGIIFFKKCLFFPYFVTYICTNYVRFFDKKNKIKLIIKSGFYFFHEIKNELFHDIKIQHRVSILREYEFFSQLLCKR